MSKILPLPQSIREAIADCTTVAQTEQRQRIVRWTKNNPCPICGGWQSAPRGLGIRCHGFQLDDNTVLCSREEHDEDETYVKTLENCGLALHKLDTDTW